VHMLLLVMQSSRSFEKTCSQICEHWNGGRHPRTKLILKRAWPAVFFCLLTFSYSSG
jgi:hypothetical protein